MRYMIIIQGKVRGPYELWELPLQQNVTRETLVCPEFEVVNWEKLARKLASYQELNFLFEIREKSKELWEENRVLKTECARLEDRASLGGQAGVYRDRVREMDAELTDAHRQVLDARKAHSEIKRQMDIQESELLEMRKGPGRTREQLNELIPRLRRAQQKVEETEDALSRMTTSHEAEQRESGRLRSRLAETAGRLKQIEQQLQQQQYQLQEGAQNIQREMSRWAEAEKQRDSALGELRSFRAESAKQEALSQRTQAESSHKNRELAKSLIQKESALEHLEARLEHLKIRAAAGPGGAPPPPSGFKDSSLIFKALESRMARAEQFHRPIASKMDQLAAKLDALSTAPAGPAPGLGTLEQRLDRMEKLQQPIADKIDKLAAKLTAAPAAAARKEADLKPLEDRLSRIEQGLKSIASAPSAPAPTAAAREEADLKPLVDRLSRIEQGLKSIASAPSAPAPPASPAAQSRGNRRLYFIIAVLTLALAAAAAALFMRSAAPLKPAASAAPAAPEPELITTLERKPRTRIIELVPVKKKPPPRRQTKPRLRRRQKTRRSPSLSSKEEIEALFAEEEEVLPLPGY